MCVREGKKYMLSTQCSQFFSGEQEDLLVSDA